MSSPTLEKTLASFLCYGGKLVKSCPCCVFPPPLLLLGSFSAQLSMCLPRDPAAHLLTALPYCCQSSLLSHFFSKAAYLLPATGNETKGSVKPQLCELPL